MLEEVPWGEALGLAGSPKRFLVKRIALDHPTRPSDVGRVGRVVVVVVCIHSTIDLSGLSRRSGALCTHGKWRKMEKNKQTPSHTP